MTKPKPYSMIRLRDLETFFFNTKDDLVNALQDMGDNSSIALKYHEAEQVYVIMEMRTFSW